MSRALETLGSELIDRVARHGVLLREILRRHAHVAAHAGVVQRVPEKILHLEFAHREPRDASRRRSDFASSIPCRRPSEIGATKCDRIGGLQNALGYRLRTHVALGRRELPAHSGVETDMTRHCKATFERA